MTANSFIQISKVGQEGRDCIYCGSAIYTTQGKWQKCTTCQAVSLNAGTSEQPGMACSASFKSSKRFISSAVAYLVIVFGASMLCMKCYAQEPTQTQSTRSTK